MEQGTVKWFNDAKSYGVVIADKGDEIICESWHVQTEPKTLFEFQRIEFDRFEHDGVEKATNIRVIENRDLSMYDHEFVTAEGEKVHLSKYLGQVVMIVNVASECGLTHQYTGLQDLYERYKWAGNGFEILAFPCDQFANQEPGSDEDILNFVRNEFGVTFTMMGKSNVVGQNKIDFDTFEENKVDDVNPFYAQLKQITGETPQWNFHKYLMSKNGQEILSFDHFVDPTDEKIIEVVERMLKGQI